MRRSSGLWMVLAGCASASPDAQKGTTGSTGSTAEQVDSSDPGVPVDTAPPWSPSGCGDGVLDPGELCDEGAGNSDSEPDACRTSCLPARCGDGVLDSDETCDDGNTVAADGCDPSCQTESAFLEVEPNNRWREPQDIGDERLIQGALPSGDTDCFRFEVSECGSVAATVAADCGGPFSLELHDSLGNVSAAGSNTATACAALEPDTADGARFLSEGAWTLCLHSPTSASLDAYALSIDVLRSDETEYALPDGEDPDGDGVPDRCDTDDDGDGIPDEEDLCPDVPDGAGAPTLTVSSAGFLRTWLAAGPYTGTSSTDRCRPSDDALVHESDDALAVPTLAAAAGDLIWTTLSSSSDRVDFLADYGGVAAPREVYTAAWVRGAAGDAIVAMGPDDGVRVWFDGVEVLDVSGCQGTNIDQFQADVTLSGDWQLLVVKVRDQRGGWGNYARFLDASGVPITGLEVALTPDGSPLPSTDTDGDGLGDACDPTPAG